MGSVTKGEKQIYYLKYIETKTHVACFVTNKSLPGDFSDAIQPTDLTMLALLTGSTNDRPDGLSANKTYKTAYHCQAIRALIRACVMTLATLI